MAGRFANVPRIKGLDNAVQLLAVIRDAEGLEKTLEAIKGYIQEAKQYADTLGGLERVQEYVEEQRKIIDEQNRKSVNYFQSVKNKDDAHKERVELFRKEQKKDRRAIATERAEIENERNELKQERAMTARERAKFQELQKDLEVREQALREDRADYEAAKARLDQAMKVVEGDIE